MDAGRPLAYRVLAYRVLLHISRIAIELYARLLMNREQRLNKRMNKHMIKPEDELLKFAEPATVAYLYDKEEKPCQTNPTFCSPATTPSQRILWVVMQVKIVVHRTLMPWRLAAPASIAHTPHVPYAPQSLCGTVHWPDSDSIRCLHKQPALRSNHSEYGAVYDRRGLSLRLHR